MILVTGATGFVGRQVVERLVDGGQPVRALMRNETRASVLPSDVEVAVGDVLDAGLLSEVMDGIEAVVHLVAVIRETGDLTFQRVNYEGTNNVLEASKSAGVHRLVYASTVGATSDPAVPYLYSRWMAEEQVSRSGLTHTIIRFSVGFGEGDEFFNRFGALAKLFPLVPVVGDGKAVFQPIAVEDVARCIVESLQRDDLAGKTIDIGGPEYFTYDEMMDLVAETLDVKITKAHVPVSFMASAATIMEALVPHPPATREQLKMLKLNNTADLDSVAKHFDFQPRPVRGNIDYIRKIGLGDALKMNLGFTPEHVRNH